MASSNPWRLPCLVALLVLTAGKPNDGLDAVFAPLSKIETVQGRFVQKKKLKAFDDVQVQKGYFKSGKNTVLFVVTDPVKSIFAVKGSKALVQFPELDYQEVTDLDASPTMGEAVKSILAVLGATSAEAIRKSYSARVKKLEDGWRVTLKPTDETMARAIEKVVMRVHADGRVSRVQIHEKNGDSTTLEFSDVVFNEPVDDPLLDF